MGNVSINTSERFFFLSPIHSITDSREKAQFASFLLSTLYPQQLQIIVVLDTLAHFIFCVSYTR